MTPIKTAVILAAGMGLRLNPLFKDCPKGFIRLGRQPIIEESIRRLIAAGMSRIVIVTGFKHRFYDELCSRYRCIETVMNPHYAESGSMYSLYCARERLGEDFLLLESDLIYESRALGELLDREEKDLLLISGPTGAGDEVYVETGNGCLVNMSKDKTALGSVAGELVGITRVSYPFFQEMIRAMAPCFSRTRHLDYESDGMVAAARKRPMHCHKIPDLVWGEIDDAVHMERAKGLIYPQLTALKERR